MTAVTPISFAAYTPDTLADMAGKIAVFATEDGKLNATFELVCLTGWSPADTQPQPLRPGSAKMRLADALKVPETKVPDRDQ